MEMMPVRKWKLGEDLYPEDNMLDGFTIEDVIVLVKCNCEELTQATARKELEQMLASRLEDMYFLFDNNIDKILEIARSRRSN